MYLKKIREMSPEELSSLKASVIESVRSSGAADLANYLLSIYQTVAKQRETEENLSGKRKFIVKQKNKSPRNKSFSTIKKKGKEHQHERSIKRSFPAPERS